MSNKDWTGDKNSVFKCLSANSHCNHEYEKNSFYATDPKALELFLDRIDKDGIKLNHHIWECACGEGNLSEVLKSKGYDVYSSDLINRGYGIGNINFLDTLTEGMLEQDILTNPPYKYALEFVKHALEIQENGYNTVMLLKIQFLEGKERYKFFQENPPKFVYVHSERQKCYPNNDMSDKSGSAVCYAWFVWEKGFKGDTIVRWI